MSTKIAIDKIYPRSKQLFPEQVPIKRRNIVASNFFEKRMIKHEPRSIFNNYVLLLQAALFESKPEIFQYVPRPFDLLLNNKPYIPDFFIRTLNSSSVVDLNDSPRKKNGNDQLSAFFNEWGYKYRVYSVADVIEQRIKAQNWLLIVQHLYLYKEFVSFDFEEEILNDLRINNSKKLKDVIGHKTSNRFEKLNAVYQLLQSGKLKMDLDNSRLNYDMFVSHVS